MTQLVMEKRFPMSLTISLPSELENRVRDHVASGLYGSASEVVGEALRLFESYQTDQIASLAALKTDVSQGIADVQTGHVAAADLAAIKLQGRAVLQSRRMAV
jgi:antitoxin ParD1/3/4